MQIFNGSEQNLPDLRRGIALGFFDGVHHGHLELLRTLIYHCQARKLCPTVFTFTDHPARLLRNGHDFPGYLADLSERLQKIADSGITETHLEVFSPEFARIEPKQFLDQYLDQRLQARLLVVGSDYRFGRDGSGDVDFLQNWASKRGIEVFVVAQVRLDGQKVASSAIRQAIEQGDVEQAARMLGHPYQLGGKIISGRGLGKKMGFPTANLHIPAGRVCPAYGVYATRTWVNEQMIDSVTNIGLRPTVETNADVPLVETYLFDTDRDLYNQPVRVEFLHRLRAEEKFNSLLRLSSQISQDLRDARQWHQDNEQSCQRASVNGIPLHWLPTQRFAQSAFSLIFRCPMEKKLTTVSALLIRVLAACCRKYPSRPAMAAALDYLYGARIDAQLEKQGDLQSLVFTATGLRSWIDQTSPFADTVSLLFDLLLDPLLDHEGYFNADIVESERQNLQMEWLARENDRSKYAYDRCMEAVCADQPHGISSLGDRTLLASVSRDDLKQAYQAMLSQMQAAAYAAGAYDGTAMEQFSLQLERLPVANRPFFRPGSCPSLFIPAEPKAVREEKDLAQSRIVMTYGGLPPYFSFQSITAALLNNMLGGDVYSLLFDVVREQMGLAYQVFSLSQRYLSLIIMMAGVAPDQVDAARQAMADQLARLANGDFADSLFSRARQMTETAVLAMNDDLHTLLSHQIASLTHGRLLTITDLISLLRQIEKADIMALAARLEPSVSYLLTPGPSGPETEQALCSHQEV